MRSTRASAARAASGHATAVPPSAFAIAKHDIKYRLDSIPLKQEIRLRLPQVTPD
jgi:hypothetical protein